MHRIGAWEQQQQYLTLMKLQNWGSFQNVGGLITSACQSHASIRLVWQQCLILRTAVELPGLQQRPWLGQGWNRWKLSPQKLASRSSSRSLFLLWIDLGKFAGGTSGSGQSQYRFSKQEHLCLPLDMQLEVLIVLGSGCWFCRTPYQQFVR